MENSTLLDSIIWFLTVILIFTFTIFDMMTWGKYAYFLISLCVFFIYVFSKKGKFVIKIGAYQSFMIAFIGFTAASSVWALSSEDTIITARTLFRILLCFYPLYLFYKEKRRIYKLINAIKWGGYLVAIYAIIFYGLNSLILASQMRSYRMGNDFANANQIGLICAVALLIQLWQLIMLKMRSITALFAVPTFLVLGATQSRKAFVFIIIGFLAFEMLKGTIREEGIGKKIIYFLSGIVVVIVALFLLPRIPVFSAVTERFSMFISSITESGRADSSTIERNLFRNIGIEGWKTSPLFGVGIGCPHILTYSATGHNVYMHDNYIEMLCGGGIIGFALYYSMHAYILINLYKLKKKDPVLSILMIVFDLLLLLMDYGMVSYYSKSNCLFLMTLFLSIIYLKKVNTRGMYENSKSY